MKKIWGWARKKLRGMDLADLAAGRAVLGRMAYRQRVKRLLTSRAAHDVAKNFFKNLRTVAKRVDKERGGPVRISRDRPCL